MAGLVYVAAFAPDLGQSAGDLNNQYPPAIRKQGDSTRRKRISATNG